MWLVGRPAEQYARHPLDTVQYILRGSAYIIVAMEMLQNGPSPLAIDTCLAHVLIFHISSPSHSWWLQETDGISHCNRDKLYDEYFQMLGVQYCKYLWMAFQERPLLVVSP